MSVNIKELRKIIVESFAQSPSSTDLDFESVVEEFPVRDEEDIIQLLPYVMNKTLSLAESDDTGQFQVLETVVRMFNGLSDCSVMKASAIKLRAYMSPSQRRCIGLWFLFLKGLDAIDYVDDDLGGCTIFWENAEGTA